MADTIQERIDQTARDGFKRVRGDEGEVESLSIDDLIKADRHMASREAVSQGFLGMRYRKMVPPGAD